MNCKYCNKEFKTKDLSIFNNYYCCEACAKRDLNYTKFSLEFKSLLRYCKSSYTLLTVLKSRKQRLWEKFAEYEYNKKYSLDND